MPVAGITLHIALRFATIKERKVVLRKGSLTLYECSTAQRTHPDPAEQRRCPLKRQHAGGRAGGVAADRGRGCGAAARRWGADRCHPPGYQLHPVEKGYTGILACVHRTQEEMRRELYTVVDQGGTVVDVAVENSLYGEIRATLNLCNRYDVDNFIRQAADAPESLLSRMTGGVHLHTLRCPDNNTFARIRDALEQQELLYRKE